MDPQRLSTCSLRDLKRCYGSKEAPVTPAVIQALLQDPRKGARALGQALLKRKERQEQEQKRLSRLSTREEQLWAAGYRAVAGVDEAGMGPLAGPVVAAAVVFPPGTFITGIADSKVLSPAQRVALAQEIRGKASGIGIGLVEADEIDRINIYQAGRKAMQLAIRSLPTPPDYLLIDGRSPLPLPFPQQALVRGEQESFSIAAASIVAKVHRDQIMQAFHKQYPQYGFARHKGYGTPEHLAALRTYGPCPIHRRSYRQVRELTEGGESIRTLG